MKTKNLYAISSNEKGKKDIFIFQKKMNADRFIDELQKENIDFIKRTIRRRE